MKFYEDKSKARIVFKNASDSTHLNSFWGKQFLLRAVWGDKSLTFLRKLKPTISYSGCFSVHLSLAYLQQSFIEIWPPWVLLTVAHQCRHQPAQMSSPGDWSCNQEGPEAGGVSTGASSVAGALGKTGWNITLSSFLFYVIIWVIVNVIGNDETVRSPQWKKFSLQSAMVTIR